MPEQREQNFSNHVRLDPAFHFFLAPLTTGLFFAGAAHAWRHPDFLTIWCAIAGLALFVAIFVIRVYSLRVQDRVIRLEERLRLSALLPDADRAVLHDLTLGQLVALRFAPDTEAPGLALRAVRENLKGKQIKQAIQNWRPDYQRV